MDPQQIAIIFAEIDAKLDTLTYDIRREADQSGIHTWPNPTEKQST